MCTWYYSVDHWQPATWCLPTGAIKRCMSESEMTNKMFFSATFSRIFQSHYSLSIFPRFSFSLMHTWEKAKASGNSPSISHHFIALSGHHCLWDCAGKAFYLLKISFIYWNTAYLHSSTIEFRGSESFIQRHKPLASPSLLHRIVCLVRLKLSITEGGATVSCTLYKFISMSAELV